MLSNLQKLAKRFTFYTKYLNRSSQCSQFRFKTFQNEIKFYFDIFKRFLILIELGKFIQKNWVNLSAELEFIKNSNAKCH